jgi:hypothetical protein
MSEQGNSEISPIKVKIDVTSSLGEKVLDALSRATAGLFGAWRIRRDGYAVADVAAYERRMLAQADVDVEAIRCGSIRVGKDGALLPAQSSPSAAKETSQADISKLLLEHAERQATADRIREQANLIKTGLLAESFAAERLGPIGDGNVSTEWLNRWRIEAQRVDDDDLRQIWARLLTEEVATPGSHPIRLVNLLGSLSKSDAKLIESLGRYVYNSLFIVETLFQVRFQTFKVFNNRISLDNLMYLEELGIVSGIGGLISREFRSVDPSKFVAALKSADRCIVIRADNPSLILNAEVVNLTAVGSKLVALGDFKPDEGYLNDTARAAVLSGFSAKICRWRLHPIYKDRLEVFDEADPI